MDEHETRERAYRYEDIIDLPHPTSPVHPRMSLAERAAQFSPFAALAGHEDAIQETSRVVGRRFDLSEEEKAVLDRKQQIILGFLKQGEQPMVTVTYFRPDRKKAGGEYVKRTGKVKKVREVENSLVFADGVEIPFLILPI